QHPARAEKRPQSSHVECRPWPPRAQRHVPSLGSFFSAVRRVDTTMPRKWATFSGAQYTARPVSILERARMTTGRSVDDRSDQQGPGEGRRSVPEVDRPIALKMESAK